jgi:hypothetical protein
VTCSLRVRSVPDLSDIDRAALQCPLSTLPPAMGTTCGRREREADAGERRGAILSRARVATVEGTLVHRMPVAFAGSRRSVGLGRSVRMCGARSRAVGRTGDNRCPLEE